MIKFKLDLKPAKYNFAPSKKIVSSATIYTTYNPSTQIEKSVPSK